MTCPSSCVIDDVQLHGMALRMMRDLFSNPANYGPQQKLADKFVYLGPDHADNTVDVHDWDNRDDAVHSRPTVYVRVGDITVDTNGNQNSEGEVQEDGGGKTYVFFETVDLVFRAMSPFAGEARVLSRIVLDHMCGMKDLLVNLSAGQVVSVLPVSKTAPVKLKREENMANLWACDVTVKVTYTLGYRMREAAPVVSEIISIGQLS